MPVVRPELGPTLPELLGPRVRSLPRAVRLALALLGAVVVVAVAVLLLGGSGAAHQHVVVVRQPMAFNFLYRAPFAREHPQDGELARVGGDGQSFAVQSLHLPAYRGDAAGFLPVYASGLEAQMARRYPGFVRRSEGPINVNQVQGYEIVFQFRRAGRLTFGRRMLLLPSSTARDGVELRLLARFTPAVANADAVGHNGALKTSLRSFRFGTQRP